MFPPPLQEAGQVTVGPLPLVLVLVAPIVIIILVLSWSMRLHVDLRLLRREMRLGRPLGVTILVLFVGGILLPWVAGDPPTHRSLAGWTRPSTSFLLAMGLYLFGVVLGGFTLGRLDHVWHLVRTPTTDTGEAYEPGEHVELSGEVKPASVPVAAPPSGEPCLVYTYKVEKRRFVGVGTKWVTSDYGRGGKTFELDDGSGPILVDPEGASLDLTEYEVLTESARGTRRERISGIAVVGTASDDPDASDRRRTWEMRLDPGETAYVLGEIAERSATDGGPEHVVTGASSPFVISDVGVSERKRQLYIVATVFGPGGIVSAVVGARWMLSLAGII